MHGIYIKKHIKGGDIWNPLKQLSVSSFMGDPARTGNIYLHPENESILEQITDSTSHDQFNAFYNSCKLFATNYGLAGFFSPGSTQIRSPIENDRGYIIIQLTDMIVDMNKFPEYNTSQIRIDINPLKMASAGREYRIDGDFNDILEDLKKTYDFIGPEEDEMPFSWFMKIRKDIKEKQIENISPEFVDHVNEVYYNTFFWSKPVTRDSLIEEFAGKFFI